MMLSSADLPFGTSRISNSAGALDARMLVKMIPRILQFSSAELTLGSRCFAKLALEWRSTQNEDPEATWFDEKCFSKADAIM